MDISKSLLSNKAEVLVQMQGNAFSHGGREREKKGFFKNNVSALIKMLMATPFDPWNRPQGNMTDVCEVVGMVFMATRLIIKKENQL